LSDSKNKQKQNKNKLHTMKNKIAIASAFLAAASFSTAEIVLNDFLSFEGFVDSSYSHTSVDFAGENDNESSFGVDQVEISWLFDFDTVTAQIDLEYEEGDDRTSEVEQAFVTYHFDNGGAVTAGRYASMLGFEAFEPTGLYQFSFAYDMLIGDVSVLPGYAQGVKYTQESDTTFFGISIQDEAYDLGSDQLGGNDDASSYAVEVAGSMQAGNGLTFFLGGVYEDGEEDETDSYAINAYVTFETGAWIFAAEVNYGDFEDGSALASAAEDLADTFGANGSFLSSYDEQALQFLLMANFAYSDEASVTGRFTYSDHEATYEDGQIGAADIKADIAKYTLAHNYAFTDNLLLVTEVSYVDGDFSVAGDVNADFDGLQGAVELIFTF
jgi:hypothetical protein